MITPTTNNILVTTFVFAILLINSSCSNTEIEDKVATYMRQVNTDIADGDSIRIADYFTDKGWSTIKRNFNSNQEFKSFMIFLEEQEIRSSQRINDSSFQVLMGAYNEAGIYLGLVFTEEFEQLKLDEYRAGK